MKQSILFLNLVVFPFLHILFYSIIDKFTIGIAIECYAFWVIMTFLVYLSTTYFDVSSFHPYIAIDTSKPPLPEPLAVFRKNGKEAWMSKKIRDEHRAYMDRYDEDLLKNVKQ